jgi:hypothetical protein
MSFPSGPTSDSHQYFGCLLDDDSPNDADVFRFFNGKLDSRSRSFAALSTAFTERFGFDLEQFDPTNRNFALNLARYNRRVRIIEVVGDFINSTMTPVIFANRVVGIPLSEIDPDD